MTNKKQNDLTPTGNCYQAAGQFMMDNYYTSRSDDSDHVKLVHGHPTLTREPYTKYGHAWIEIDDRLCLDVESGAMLSKELFYEIGNINPDECHYYAKKDMRKWVTETGHWGPWEGPDAVGPVWNKDE